MALDSPTSTTSGSGTQPSQQPEQNPYSTPPVHSSNVPRYRRCSPVYLWSDNNDVLPQDCQDPADQPEIIRDLIIENQPHHYAVHPQNTQYTIPTYGPISHPDGFDPNNLSPTSKHELPMPRHWSPDATPEQLLQGAAKDLATLASLLAARTINATGFQSDGDTIKQFTEIANGLRNVTYVLRETKPRRGRPPAKTTAIQTGQNKRRRKNQSNDIATNISALTETLEHADT